MLEIQYAAVLGEQSCPSCRTGETAYHYFQRWKKDGAWQPIHDHLHAEITKKMGREREPSAAIIDSQSVKTTEKGGNPMDTTGQRK